MNEIVFVNHKLSDISPNEVFYGVDLGTTFTVVASIDSTEIMIPSAQLPVKLLTMEQLSPLPMDGSDKSEMMASILGVVNDRMYVGNKLYRLKGHPLFRKDANLFYHWKLDLGVSVKPLYKNAVRTDLDDAAKVAGKILNYSRIQLIGIEHEWKNVAVTVPASFLPNQRADVLQAMHYAKIDAAKSALLDEPNAAILGYLNATTVEEKRKMLHEGAKHFLVIDFGGGTCDLSLLRLRLDNDHLLKMDNLSISRYNDLGGQDIDMMIAEQILLPRFFERWQSIANPSLLETKVMPQLAVLAERLKIDMAQLIASKYLSIDKLPNEIPESLVNMVNMFEISDDDNLYLENITFTGKQLEEITSGLFRMESHPLSVVDKVIRSVPSVIDDTLEKAGLKRTEIDFLLFVGGSVQNLLFIKECSLLLPRAECLIPQRPDTLVAKGAALYSFYKHNFGIDLICPIVSDTIGMITDNADFFPLFEAGKPLPISFDFSSFRVQNVLQRRIEIPLCIDNTDKIVQVITIQLNGLHSTDDVINIRGQMDRDKVLQVQVLINGESKADVNIVNPIALANLSDENRLLMITENEYETARMNKNTAKERELLLKLIHEYYELSNYDRCISLATEYLHAFEPTNSSVLNYLYCAYDKLGQKRKAHETISKAVKYHPGNTTIQYNYTISHQLENGRKATIDYIESLSEDLQSDECLRMRHAILAHAENNKKPAQWVVANHKTGQFAVIGAFSEKLLKQVYDLLGEIWENTNQREQKKQKVPVFEKNNLLRIKDNVPDISH